LYWAQKSVPRWPTRSFRLVGRQPPLGFEGSDGLQNLTESLLAAQLVGPGVYIAMHGAVFPVGRVRKDRTLGRFVWQE
jgi:L-asparaginase